MTVKTLIEELFKFDPNKEVFFEYSYRPPCDCREYCYCGYNTERELVSTVDEGKTSAIYKEKLKNSIVVLNLK